jgi:hypothetical protein
MQTYKRSAAFATQQNIARTSLYKPPLDGKILAQLLHATHATKKKIIHFFLRAIFSLCLTFKATEFHKQ